MNTDGDAEENKRDDQMLTWKRSKPEVTPEPRYAFNLSSLLRMVAKNISAP
jgi:hypothetical protein